MKKYSPKDAGEQNSNLNPSVVTCLNHCAYVGTNDPPPFYMKVKSKVVTEQLPCMHSLHDLGGGCGGRKVCLF